MKSQFRAILFLLLLPALMVGNNDKFKGKYTKEKTLKKEYTVNSNATLEIDNSYGNVDVVSWNENRTVIEVTIRTNGNNEERVQKKLDDIDVDFSGSASRVSAKTRFNGKKNSSWSWFGNNNKNVSMEINYTIKVPVTNSVDLSNDYGSISLNRIEGRAKINCDYGQLIIGELMGENNDLNFDYTKNSTISYMKSGKINADYSGFTLDKADRLDLNADYSKSEIIDVTDLNYNCDYGRITVNKVNNLVGQGDYIPCDVGALSGSLDINADYGSITVDRITSSAGDVEIQSDYTRIKVGFDSGYNFDFVVNLQYGSLKGQESVNISHQSKSGSDKKYSGYHGSKGSGNTVNINSEYGGVTFSNH